MKNILVLGATGTVGSEVTSALVASGVGVRALVRTQSSADRLAPGVQPVFGDLRDEAAVRRAFLGVDCAFYVAPHDPDEEALTANVVRACNFAGVRLVYVGVHADGATRLSRALKRFVYGKYLMHYRPKFRQSEFVRQNVRNAVILIPTNFFQNDELFRGEILAGSFPQPFERPVNRVDVRDLALAACRALTDPSLPAGAYPVVGPESLTGEQCARSWSTALMREVRSEEDQTRVDAAIARNLEGKKREDFLGSYVVLRKVTLPTLQRELAATRELIGREPTRYADYVRGLANSWRSAQAPQKVAQP